MERPINDIVFKECVVKIMFYVQEYTFQVLFYL